MCVRAECDPAGLSSSIPDWEKVVLYEQMNGWICESMLQRGTTPDLRSHKFPKKIPLDYSHLNSHLSIGAVGGSRDPFSAGPRIYLGSVKLCDGNY